MIRNEATVKREELIIFPEVTEGFCKGNPRQRTKTHKAFQELANGYCVGCWDNGRGGALTYNQRSANKQHLKRKNKRMKAQ